MSDSTPQDSDHTGPRAGRSGEETGRVESLVGENVETIIVDEPGDTTIRPAPDYLKRILRQYKQRT